MRRGYSSPSRHLCWLIILLALRPTPDAPAAAPHQTRPNSAAAEAVRYRLEHPAAAALLDEGHHAEVRPLPARIERQLEAGVFAGRRNHDRSQPAAHHAVMVEHGAAVFAGADAARQTVFVEGEIER